MSTFAYWFRKLVTVLVYQRSPCVVPKCGRGTIFLAAFCDKHPGRFDLLPKRDTDRG